MYDVLVVGARCAGSLTAALLARRGHRVLVVDRTAFATDTLCTHRLAPPGVAALAACGLLDPLVASGCPTADRTTIWAGQTVLELAGPTCAPRRPVLEGLLLDAAAAAGAETRDCFTVSDLVWDGEQVAGVVGHGPNERTVVERARFVVGADGRRSMVADAVHAERYLEREATSCCYYAHWAEVTVPTPELHFAERRVVGIFPTNDDVSCVVATRPVQDWAGFKRAPEATYMAHLEGFPELGNHFEHASRVSRFYGTADLAGGFRRPWGPGWALVGDAGHHRDPLLGGGIADALVQAILLARALDEALSGFVPFDRALGNYHHLRDKTWRAGYEATCLVASFAWRLADLPALLRSVSAPAAGLVSLLDGADSDRRGALRLG